MPRLAKLVNVLAIRQVKQGMKLLGYVYTLLCTCVNMLALDLIINLNLTVTIIACELAVGICVPCKLMTVSEYNC